MRLGRASSVLVLCAIVAIFALRYYSRPRPRLAPSASGPDLLIGAKDPSQPLRIVAYGDMRFTNPTETHATNPKVRRWLVDRIAEERPDAVLATGDVPWHGGDKSDYDEFRAETGAWRAAHLQIFPALGNHEFHGGEQRGLENWWSTFPELRGHRWYSVALGTSVYILNLDSNSSLLPGSAQSEWIRSQLRVLPSSVRYVFFNLHHPPIVDLQAGWEDGHNGRPNEHALAELLATATAKSHRSFVVVSGHIHNYERFSKDGITYVVSGGGGAIPRPVVRGPDDLYQDPAFPNYHYVRFVEEGEKLTGTMVRVADPDAAAPGWQEKDHFEVTLPEAK